SWLSSLARGLFFFFEPPSLAMRVLLTPTLEDCQQLIGMHSISPLRLSVVTGVPIVPKAPTVQGIKISGIVLNDLNILNTLNQRLISRPMRPQRLSLENCG